MGRIDLHILGILPPLHMSSFTGSLCLTVGRSESLRKTLSVTVGSILLGPLLGRRGSDTYIEGVDYQPRGLSSHLRLYGLLMVLLMQSVC